MVIKTAFDDIYERAECLASYLQPWDGHYLTRKTETEILAGRSMFSKSDVGLELGCGNAFQSVLLASLSKKVFATDLFFQNGSTHSLGISKAKDLIGKMKIDNIRLVSCSAGFLPFESGYFDYVFSSSVLEHVSDRLGALKEMLRVLKSGGRLILILPTHMPSIYAFVHLFFYVIGWGIKKLNNGRKDCGASSSIAKKSAVKRFFDNHPSFPLPEPHGTYKNIFIEMSQQFPERWTALIKKAGFNITDIFPTCVIPWLLIEPFSERCVARLYASTKKIHEKILSRRIFTNISYLVVFAAVKKKE